MKSFLRILAIALFVVSGSVSAQAACAGSNCFWIGGTGTLDLATDSAHWSTSSGGTTCSCEPGASDNITFDGSSGGGTITVNAAVDVNTITLGAFTGTLDFSAHNNAVTIEATANGALSITGSGTRTFNMGNGTWTFKGTAGTLIDATTTTNLTFNANSSTVLFNASSTSNDRTMQIGTLTFATVTVNGNTNNGRMIFSNGSGGTITTLNLNPSGYMTFNNNITIGTLNVNGTAYNASVALIGSFSGSKTITLTTAATISWAAIAGLTFATTAPTANNSFNLGGNSNITINGPSGGGGGRIIGG